MLELEKIDNQTLKLVDYLIALHKETQTNLDLINDYSFGVKFYPHNKYIVTHMRGKEVKGGKGKHVPQLLIINIGKAFNVDFNFFYDETIDVKDAFLSEQKTISSTEEESIDGIFKEIEKRLELFVQENKQLKNKEERKYCHETENELLNIKTHFNKSFSKDSLAEKRAEIIEVFDRMIFISRKKMETMRSKATLEQHINTLTSEAEQLKEDKVNLEKSMLKLNTDLGASNRMAFEAQKGQTEALKQLLAIQQRIN